MHWRIILPTKYFTTNSVELNSHTVKNRKTLQLNPLSKLNLKAEFGKTKAKYKFSFYISTEKSLTAIIRFQSCKLLLKNENAGLPHKNENRE